MPRTEKIIAANRGAVGRFAEQLRALRVEAGTPTYRDLATRTGYSVTQLSQAASGRRLPTWAVVHAYVTACGGDPSRWKQTWEHVRNEAAERPVHAQGKSPPAKYSHAAALISHPLSAPPTVHIPHPRHPTATVVLVDDHEIVRRGVTKLFENMPDIDVIGQAGTVATAKETILRLRPQVVILDVRLPDGNGIELCESMRRQIPGLRCLMLTSYTDDAARLDAVRAGASGFVLKHVQSDELVAAVHTVAAGESLFDPREAPLDYLSDQEGRVFELVGEGLTNRQIADQLYMAEKTVKNHVSSVLAKLNMQRRAQVAVLAAEIKSRQR